MVIQKNNSSRYPFVHEQGSVRSQGTLTCTAKVQMKYHFCNTQPRQIRGSQIVEILHYIQNYQLMKCVKAN